MHRLTKKIATALIGLGALSGAINDVQACPGGGGGRGFGGGFRHAHRAPAYPQPRYVQPAPQPYYQQPAYQQPSYSQPSVGSYGNPSFAQSNPQFAGPEDGGVHPSQLPPTVKKMARPRPSGGVSPQLSQGQPLNSQPPAQQPGQPLNQGSFETSGGQQLASQPGGRRPPASRSASQAAGGLQASGNPLQALGGAPSQGQPQGGQQQFAGTQGGQEQLNQEEGPAPQAAPRQQMARRPQSQPTQPSQPQESSPMDTAQLSALEALGGLETEEPQQLEAQAQPQAEPQEVESLDEAQPVQASRSTGRPQRQMSHVGQWTAALQNGSKVQLTLQADGNFSWVATSGEKVSSFEGNYTVSGGSLTLVRSSDNQKLVGSMTPAGSSSFTFKLTGAKDTGLQFSRS